jgi:iron complex transport system permease protein
MMRVREPWIIAAAGAALVALAVFATLQGVTQIGADEALRALFSPILPPSWRTGLADQDIAILTRLRLPRTLLAAIAGASLAAAGVAMQGITRNPLVSPYTIGISPAASFGACLAILAMGERGMSGQVLLVGAAFVSALVCAALVLGLASLRGISGTVLVLAGVGLSYLFGALTSTLQFIATEQQLAVIIHWAFGSVNGASWDAVLVTGIVLLACLPVLQAQAWALNAFAAGGDEVAASLGFAVTRTRVIVTLASVLMTAAVVSFAGVIGFVGLIAPHVGRLLIGGDHRRLLPFATIVGAGLLLVADLAGRLLFAPVTVPVGIVVAYLGVPLFLHLLLRPRAHST